VPIAYRAFEETKKRAPYHKSSVVVRIFTVRDQVLKATVNEIFKELPNSGDIWLTSETKFIRHLLLCDWFAQSRTGTQEAQFRSEALHDYPARNIPATAIEAPICSNFLEQIENSDSKYP
jgi:hypothetical protein